MRAWKIQNNNQEKSFQIKQTFVNKNSTNFKKFYIDNLNFPEKIFFSVYSIDIWVQLKGLKQA